MLTRSLSPVVLTIGALLLAGCSASRLSSGACPERSVARCRCDDGARGTQLCRGGAYDPCVCGSTGPVACAPGAVAACRCDDGGRGTQRCAGDGHFGRCECDGPGPGDAGMLADAETPRDASAPADADGSVCLDCGVETITVALNDVIVDPTRPLLYGSVPSTDTAHGNEIVAIDPERATILWSVLVGSEPGPLAIADDGSVLYVGLQGAAAVRRVDLETRAPGLEFTLGSDRSGPRYAGDIEVLPGTPSVVAISMRNRRYSPDFEGVAIFDDGSPRPEQTSDHTGARMIEAASPTRLWGYNNSNTEFGFRALTVDGSGVREQWVARSLVSGFETDIEYAAGRIFATDGAVLDPEGMRRLGQLAAQGPLAVEPDGSRVYFAVTETFGDLTGIAAFDPATYRGVATRRLSSGSGRGRARRLVRFGADGFAVLVGPDYPRDQPGNLLFVRAPELTDPAR